MRSVDLDPAPVSSLEYSEDPKLLDSAFTPRCCALVGPGKPLVEACSADLKLSPYVGSACYVETQYSTTRQI